MNLLEIPYFRAMSARRATNLAKRVTHSVPCPIVSVGNMTTGGTGKTPTVQWISRFLSAQGFKVGVVGRGYRGQKSEEGALVSDGKTTFLSAHDAGDEAILHVRNLPDTVVAIGKDRHHAVQIAVDAGAQIVVLDDGFQFWSLPRDFELVLLDAKRPFDNGHLLPLGHLREDKAALARADAILLTRVDRPSMQELEQTYGEIKKWTQAPIFESWHAPLDWRDEKTGRSSPLGTFKGQRLRAFAGLADNRQFYQLVRQISGVTVDTPLRERGDHHRWRQGDFQQWTSGALENGDLPVVTTEKDAVKVNPNWFSGPFYSLRIALGLRENEEALQSLILEKLKKP